MNTVFIVTEANERVATGHLMECIACAEEFMKADYSMSFWINDDANSDLKKRIPCEYQEYQQSIEKDYAFLRSEALRLRPKALIFNLRKITEDFLKKIRECISDNTKIVCIDEFGHRNLPVDIIVNPMIDSYYWFYDESKAKLFCGAEYLILPKELETYHIKDKTINNKIKNILITMGGVDPQNYTWDLAEFVPEGFPEAVVNIVLGGGNLHKEEIIKKVAGNDRIVVYNNVSNLLEMMYEADLVFCSGGNTLHEAACIGIPAIILPSMPHEKRTASCFDEKGFGFTVNTDGDWKAEMQFLFNRISEQQVRADMSTKGKLISDGMGRKRMVKIVDEI